MKNLLFILLLLPFTSLAQLTPDFEDVYIPMRDGDSLQADVYIPTSVTTGEVILIQTPYNKDFFAWSLPMGVAQNLDAQPFIWVIVDWRGFYGSNMADVTDVKRGEDGYDVCEWIKDQAWHADRIGTWGPSALGSVQYSTMVENHPNHTCAVPQVATGTQAYEAYFYGGVLEEARLYQLDALGYGLSTIVLANHYDSFIWDVAETNNHFADDIQIPTLQIAGWYDHHVDEMMAFYEDSRNEAAVAVQDEQWLLVGPWVHGGTGSAYIGSNIQGELTYPDAEFKSDSMAWDFFEYYLLDVVNNWENTDKITYYDLGNGGWLTSNADDIEITNTDVLYLNSTGRLTSNSGNGLTSFVSDPSNPSPTIGGATLSDLLEQGPHDQSALDARTDVITFATDDLTSDIAITGRASLDVYLNADQADCDIAVRLVDVYPDGTNMLITDGIQRMRFRNGDYTATGEEFMTAGTVYSANVKLPFTKYTWKAGHQIKIYVSANHFERFNVNLQDGGAMYQAGTGNIANIDIQHSAVYPSKLNLPGNNPVLGVSKEAIEWLNIYPNPALRELRIDGNQNFEEYSIIDLQGRLVQTGNATSSIISIEDLQKGQYVLELRSPEGGTVSKTFVKR
ncbi:MAG: putative acyl esterase [Arenicella sp.]|jgi:predicted acyl esterase